MGRQIASKMASMWVRAGLTANHVRLGRPSHNMKAAKVAQPVRRQAAIRGSVRMATTANLFTSFSAKKLGTGTLDAPVEGETVSFSEYAGKVIMVQNVATL